VSIRCGRLAVAACALAAFVLLPGGIAMGAGGSGELVSIVNANAPSRATGGQFDAALITAPTACNKAATRHLTTVVGVQPLRARDRQAAQAWVGDNLYATSSVGLPGPLTVRSNGSWRQIADAFGQRIVPGTYQIELRCQDNLATRIYERWRGDVTFISATSWTGFTAAAVGSGGTTSVSPSAPATPATPTAVATTAAPGQRTATSAATPSAKSSRSSTSSTGPKPSTGAKPSPSTAASTGGEPSKSVAPSTSASVDAAVGIADHTDGGGGGGGLATTAAALFGFGLLGFFLILGGWAVIRSRRRGSAGPARVPR
jgi:hypothetical protein